MVRRVCAVDRRGGVRADTGGVLPVGTEMPELARDRFELTGVFRGEPAYSQFLFEGSDGRLYKTGYAPIFLENRVVGAVGVEGNAEFFGPLKRLLRSYLLLVAIALLALGALALLRARGQSAKRALPRPRARSQPAAGRSAASASAGRRTPRCPPPPPRPPHGSREKSERSRSCRACRRCLRTGTESRRVRPERRRGARTDLEPALASRSRPAALLRYRPRRRPDDPPRRPAAPFPPPRVPPISAAGSRRCAAPSP